MQPCVQTTRLCVSLCLAVCECVPLSYFPSSAVCACVCACVRACAHVLVHVPLSLFVCSLAPSSLSLSYCTCLPFCRGTVLDKLAVEACSVHYTRDEILRTLLAVQFNAFSTGVYYALALVNHHCKPNCKCALPAYLVYTPWPFQHLPRAASCGPCSPVWASCGPCSPVWALAASLFAVLCACPLHSGT